jgi:hypothetical protein
MTLVLVIVAFVSLLHPCGALTAPAGDPPEPTSLWQTASSSTASDLTSGQRRAWVLREREIAVDVPLLEILKDATARPHPRVTVEFFDGIRHELDITSTVSRFNDTAVIRGSFKPPSRGDFTLIASGHLLMGNLRLGERLYRTEHAGNGRVKLLEVDPRKLPPE